MLAIIDEYGAHPDMQLYEVMRSSQTYKLNAQIVAITTAKILDWSFIQKCMSKAS